MKSLKLQILASILLLLAFSTLAGIFEKCIDEGGGGPWDTCSGTSGDCSGSCGSNSKSGCGQCYPGFWLCTIDDVAPTACVIVTFPGNCEGGDCACNLSPNSILSFGSTCL